MRTNFFSIRIKARIYGVPEDIAIDELKGKTFQQDVTKKIFPTMLQKKKIANWIKWLVYQQ